MPCGPDGLHSFRDRVCGARVPANRDRVRNYPEVVRPLHVTPEPPAELHARPQPTGGRNYDATAPHCSRLATVRGVLTVVDVRRLPVPVTAIWEWQLRAACRDIDSTVFFHPDNERGPAKDLRDRRAKVVCTRCPVIDECRRHALEVQEPYGVWGGLTVAERAVILRGTFELVDRHA